MFTGRAETSQRSWIVKENRRFDLTSFIILCCLDFFKLLCSFFFSFSFFLSRSDHQQWVQPSLSPPVLPSPLPIKVSLSSLSVVQQFANFTHFLQFTPSCLEHPNLCCVHLTLHIFSTLDPTLTYSPHRQPLPCRRMPVNPSSAACSSQLSTLLTPRQDSHMDYPPMVGQSFIVGCLSGRLGGAESSSSAVFDQPFPPRPLPFECAPLLCSFKQTNSVHV